MILRHRTQSFNLDLFQWADAQKKRHRRSPIFSQVISRGHVTELHARVFIVANGLVGEVR